MAFVLTSISGNLISAASAGFAPTNSGDVSAIASGYQVVSSTATQLYAGTAYLTSVNDAPMSASRAGNAANASMANSAYYDGTGRLISALPDSAEVSSIASSYAESAVSGKADSSALSSYALSSDVSGVIDTVSSNSASWGGGGATGDYVEKSATDVAIGTPSPSASGCGFAHGLLAKAENYSVALAGYEVTALNTSFAQGYYANANQSSFVQGVSSKAVNNSFAQGTQNTASGGGCFAQGYGNKAYTYSFAQGYDNMASDRSFAQGLGNIASHSSTAFGQYNLHHDGDTATGDSAAFTIGDGSFGARHDLMLVTKDGEITMFSSTSDTTGTGILSSIRAISAAATGGGSGDYVEKSSTELEIGSACFASASTPYYLGSFAQGRENSAIDISVAQGRMNSAYSQSLSQGESNSASARSLAQGELNYAENRCLTQGYGNTAKSESLAQGGFNSSFVHSLAQGDSNSAIWASFAQGTLNSAYNTSVAIGVENTAKSVSFAHGVGISALYSATVFGTYNKSGEGLSDTTGAAFVIGDGKGSAERHDLMVVTKGGEITLYSSTADTVGTGIMSSIRAISAAATGGGVDSATVSAIASSYAESAVSSKLDESATADFYSTSNPSSFVDSAYVDSAVSGKLDESASSSFYTTANESGFLTGLPKNISVTNLSASGHVRATATGQDLYGNFDYAGMYFRSGSQRPYNIGIDNTGTNFYIATAKNGFERIYASSIQSWNDKLDSSASSSFYTTDNVSGFVDSAYVDSAVSGKADSSALSSYALSADVSGTIDLVSTQSANWGGSALQLSAGPGVSLEKVGDTLVAGLALSAGPGVKLDQVGDTLVASQDVTVLWSGAGSTTGSTITLNESLANFERYGMYYYIPYQNAEFYQEAVYSAGQTDFGISTNCINSVLWRTYCDYGTMNSTSISPVSGRQAGMWMSAAGWQWYDGSDRHHYFTKIVGINRTAGV